MKHLKLAPMIIEVEEGAFPRLQSLTLSLRTNVSKHTHTYYKEYFENEQCELGSTFISYFESTKSLQRISLGGLPPPPHLFLFFS